MWRGGKEGGGVAQERAAEARLRWLERDKRGPDAGYGQSNARHLAFAFVCKAGYHGLQLTHLTG